MKTVIVKLDSKFAHIYDWPNTNHAPKVIEESHIDHHTHAKNDEDHHSINKFFHTVALELEKADEVYLLGNHMTNAEFKHHVEKHHHAQLLKKIVGTDNINGHATDAEVKTKANEFFTKFRAFNKNY